MPSVRAKDDASTLGCRQAVRHQTLTLTCVGSNPAIPAKYDPLAQSVEQLPFKQWVWSSNLQRVTKKADTHLGICFLAVWRFEKFNGTVRWTVPWHRLDDANSLPGASAPGQRISSGSLRTKGLLQTLAAALRDCQKTNAARFSCSSENHRKTHWCGSTSAPLCKGWCSAQRIKITMTAGGSHTTMYCWQKSLIFD